MPHPAKVRLLAATVGMNFFKLEMVTSAVEGRCSVLWSSRGTVADIQWLASSF